MSVEHCRSCLRKHRSGLWYGSGEFRYCTASYQRMLRQQKVAHPSWPVFEAQVHSTDSTGAWIGAALFRRDVQAIADASALLQMYPALRRHKLFISLLAAQYYYSWPMHVFVHQLGAAHTGRHLDVSLIRRVGRRVFRQFKQLRVRDGRLSYGRSGVSCTANPSERLSGQVRFGRILRHSNVVLDACALLDTYFESSTRVSLRVMLQLLRGSVVFGHLPVYKNVRCCRILSVASGKVFANNAQDWSLLIRMTPHVQDRAAEYGLVEYSTAIRFVVAMAEELSIPEYSINDLCILLCLLP